MKFFIHFLKNLKKTGAVAPSSKFLVRDLISHLQRYLARDNSEPLNILEIGPGTGSLTKEIVKALRPEDRLDVVEIQKSFYKVIQKKYSRSNVFVHHSDILTFNPNVKYDYIFSSLPYENMSKDVNRKIWQKKLNLCSSPAYICYFKYVNFRDFKNDFEEEIVEKFIYDKKIVLRNLPPAKLFILQVEDRPDEIEA